MELLTSVYDETGFMMILFAAGVCMLSSMNDMAAAGSRVRIVNTGMSFSSLYIPAMYMTEAPPGRMAYFILSLPRFSHSK